MYRALPQRVTFVHVTVLLALSAGLGCETTVAPSARPQKRTPEESFDRLVVAVRRDLEGTTSHPSMGIGNRSGEVTALTTHRKITNELFPPDGENDTYTAKITVESKTSFSSAVPPREEDDASEKKESDDSRFDLGGESNFDADADDSFSSTGGLGGDIKLGGQASRTAKKRRSGSSGVRSVQQSQSEWAKTYDLAYEDGRWVVKTEIEDDGILAVFEMALRQQ